MNEKTKYILIFFTIIIVILAYLVLAQAPTVTLTSPDNNTWTKLSNNSLYFNFTCTGVNATYDAELFINNLGYGVKNVINGTASFTLANVSILEGNDLWYINCTNGTDIGSSETRTLKVDYTPPSVTSTPYNFTSVTNLDLQFNVSINDSIWGLTNINTTWIYINDTMNTKKSSAYFGLTNTAGETWNYTFLPNITSDFFGPGPHFVQFCANDTVGNENCTWSFGPFIIKIVNASQVEDLLSIISLNASYENDTDIGKGTAIPGMNPAEYNYTFVFNISNLKTKVVGFQINETLAANLLQTSLNTTTTTSLNSAVLAAVSGLTNITTIWPNVSAFLPEASLYKYAELIFDKTYDTALYCNGTSVNDPGTCTRASECSGTVNISTHLTIIPANSGCYINNVSGDSKTHLYLDHLSGGAAADDNTAPTISFSCSSTSVLAGETITCSCSATDNVDASPSVSYTVNPSTGSIGTFITTCTATDDSGNSASSFINYTVSVSGPTTIPTTEEIQLTKEGIIKEIFIGSKLKFELKNVSHTIKFVAFTSKTATFLIESPLTLVLAINETKEVDVDKDGKNDMSITLHEINVVSSKAKITIKFVVPVPEKEIKPEILCGNNVVNPGENCENCPQDVKCKEDEKCVNGKCVKKAPPAPPALAPKTWLWIVIVIIVIIAIIIWLATRKKK